MLKAMLVIYSLIALTPTAVARPAGKDTECGAPTYRVARIYSRSPEVEAIAVSIDPRDATIRNLLALACKLRADYPNQFEVGAEIFNNYQAAKWTNIHGVENSRRGNKAAYLATYNLNRKKGKETLTLAVDPNHPCGNDIEIDLIHKQVGFVSCK